MLCVASTLQVHLNQVLAVMAGCRQFQSGTGGWLSKVFR